MKRKRKCQSTRDSKRQRVDNSYGAQHPIVPLLNQYYQEVHSLRTYLVSRLPKSSKKRRRRLLHYGLQPVNDDSIIVEQGVVELLDSILVGTSKHVSVQELDQLDQDISVFTQQVSETDISVTPSAGHLRQSEIVDFAIWSLFRRHAGSYKPSHLLCHGYQRSAAAAANGTDARAVPGVPGVFLTCGNPYVSELKEYPWSNLPELLGRGAERILSELLKDCGLYRPVSDSSNARQICGIPLSDLKTGAKEAQAKDAGQDAGVEAPVTKRDAKRGLADIRFLRHRMLYARPALKASGAVRFGMTYVHVLSRYRNLGDPAETIHVMKHIFPHQFSLHNAFTSSTNLRDTSQPFMDYTMREQEIQRARARRKYRPGKPALPADKIPRRLRGYAFRLVERIRKRHSRCSYKALFDCYCPRMPHGTPEETNTFTHAATLEQVSAFCRAVIRNVFPPDAFGSSAETHNNLDTVMRSIDRFIRLRRYETISLHDVMHGIALGEIEWLIPVKADKASKLCKTDFETRRDIMAELLYYLFDSFLVPLIRSHFHVTESGAQRNQLFYFRHDVWKAMAEPAIDSLKLAMFEECSTVDLQKAMAQRALGVSKVRLLPKEQGMRPIINLRRRVQRQQHGNVMLGRSINSVLTPAFTILNYEKTARPKILGSALFSVDEMFARLQSFRTSLDEQGRSGSPLYFAKVDVKSCFDTIPQERLLQLAGKILSANEYQLTRYARAKLLGGHNEETPGFGAKPSWKYLTKATVNSGGFDLDDEIRSEAITGRTRTAFVGGSVHRSERRKEILDLLHQHVESNIIKLGNRFYRQKKGIPQGSIVSGLLCSYFYAELERNVLGFIEKKNSLLLRLIDDFLIITTDRNVAEMFMRTMHAGVPEFGVEVKADKSRINFDMKIDDIAVARLPTETEFPYCGNAINTVTLDLSKDMERRKAAIVQDSVTVEYSKLQGQSFYRKTLNALKLHMRAMHLSTSYNSLETVLSNLHHAFNEVAHKSYAYIKSLPNGKQPSSKLIIRTVDDLIKLACALTKSRAASKGKNGAAFECAVTSPQTRW
ncbi:hypothetical protein Q7P37_002762 [Cladosporium fusiforme]